MEHFLIVEDHQDVFENLERKIQTVYPEAKIDTATNCDIAFEIIDQSKIKNPITVLILDLTFTSIPPNSTLKNGQSLLRKLKDESIKIPTIIYSSHDELEHIYPIINNYSPRAYVVKTHNSSEELLLCIKKISQSEHEYFYSQKVNNLLRNRVKYSCNLDETDELIIQKITSINAISDWDNTIPTPTGFMSYTSIKKRINKICTELDVDNEKQLVLKLRQLGII